MKKTLLLLLRTESLLKQLNKWKRVSMKNMPLLNQIQASQLNKRESYIMAYYTHDGIRHNTQEEELEYLKQLITTVPPANDECTQKIHNPDWGNYEVLRMPQDS